MTRTENERILLQAILGLLDGVSDNALPRLRAHKITTATTKFMASDVYTLLDAVEAVEPGLLDHYADLRAQAAEQ